MLRRQRSDTGTDGHVLAEGETAAIIRVAAHDYELAAVFVQSGKHTVRLSVRGPFDTDWVSRTLPPTIDFAAAIRWLEVHEYHRSSRRDAGRVGTLEVFDSANRHRLTFNRSGEVVEPNPVNTLIDSCAQHVPILIGGGTCDERNPP